jgi:hypothetical protein
VAVDSKYKFIVAQGVTNAGSDLGLLGPTALAAKEALGVPTIQAVADKGYYQGEDLKACEQAGIETYVARPQRGAAVREGHFRKEEFAYDAARDVYHSPRGQELRPRYRLGEDRLIYCNREACGECPLRSRCTTRARSVHPANARRPRVWGGQSAWRRPERGGGSKPWVSLEPRR